MPDSTSQPDQQGHGAEEATGAAAALAAIKALAKGLTDPFMPSRLRRYAALVKGEETLWGAFSKLLGDWLAGVRREVVRPSGAIDQMAIQQAAPAYAAAVGKLMDVQVETIFRDAFEDVAHPDDWEPYGVYRAQDYISQARNLMVRTPDSVYDLVRQEVAKAVNDGDSVQELASRIGDILSETGTPTWRNRALVVARTEAVSAYNAGAFAGFQSLATQLGGEWEKGWIATEDERTRPTHRVADGQRVPLDQPFQVGEAEGMFPGDPELPPGERIQCRCSIVLVRPGEEIDMSNRQMRGGGK